MAAWRHALCDECWRSENPQRRPVRVVPSAVERCCLCGEPTRSGIYVRRDPSRTPCGGGAHEERPDAGEDDVPGLRPAE